LRLVSRDEEYIARVAFAYQEDEDLRWRAFQAEQEQAKQQIEDAQVVAPVTVRDDYSNLYFNYQVKGKNPSLMPVRVMDDGDKTYLTMPDALLHLDLPALVVMNPRLKGEKAQEIVNYRVKGNLFIVDRLFDRGALLIGNGKTAESVDIRRHDPLITFKTSATNAPMVSANGGSK
jgi:type IV secretion system protein VirB9